MAGDATVLRRPEPLDALGVPPYDRWVGLDLTRLRHTGHAYAAPGSRSAGGAAGSGSRYRADLRRCYLRPGRFPLRAAGLPVRVERRFTYRARAASYSVRRSFSPGASISERKK